LLLIEYQFTSEYLYILYYTIAYYIISSMIGLFLSFMTRLGWSSCLSHKPINHILTRSYIRPPVIVTLIDNELDEKFIKGGGPGGMTRSIALYRTGTEQVIELCSA